MRVLIIGCGYVGIPLGAALAQEGHVVHGLRRDPASQAELRAAGITPLMADVTKKSDLAKLPSGFDWIVNCVASSGGGSDDYRKVYLEGTRNLIEWLTAAPPKKFVYTSSTSVYGQTDGSLVSESSATEPSADTARILVQTERLLLEALRYSNLPVVILRLAGIYGPERGHWLRQFLQSKATIEGRGERLLNMIHRDDVIGAIIAALNHGQPGEIYNIVDDEPVTQLGCFRWLSETLGKPMPPSGPNAGEPAAKRARTHKSVSNQKLKKDLGYEFKYPTFRPGYLAELKRLDLLDTQPPTWT